jgi:hypothetical protein
MATENQIRNRQSFERYKNLASELIKLGLPKNNIGKALNKVDRFIDSMSGYGSRSAVVCL